MLSRLHWARARPASLTRHRTLAPAEATVAAAAPSTTGSQVCDMALNINARAVVLLHHGTGMQQVG